MREGCRRSIMQIKGAVSIGGKNEKNLFIILVSCIGLTIMISCSEKEESSSSSSTITEDISFDPSSFPDNGTTVVFIHTSLRLNSCENNSY